VEYDDNRRKVEFPKLIRATAKRETDKELCHIGCVKSGSFLYIVKGTVAA